MKKPVAIKYANFPSQSCGNVANDKPPQMRNKIEPTMR